MLLSFAIRIYFCIFSLFINYSLIEFLFCVFFKLLTSVILLTIYIFFEKI
uniref:Uncharacterized protein n=1 Tax=Dictyomenia sonderi TaxID=2007178 RepID=A0A1Z1MTK5_9FLOR|nr:hypothetical protein [Dictyomenia sonderi]ARW69219.1 hypothetical protein [Dictyomenia sonderi]